MGFGMAPLIQLQPFLDSGELVLLTPNKPVEIALFWQQWGIKTALSKSLSAQISAAASIVHRL